MSCRGCARDLLVMKVQRKVAMRSSSTSSMYLLKGRKIAAIPVRYLLFLRLVRGLGRNLGSKVPLLTHHVQESKSLPTRTV